MGGAILTEIAVLDEILGAHRDAIGKDFVPYRCHCYRVANLCVAAMEADGETIEKVGIAAAFHDLGIWTAHTFDYLDPSVALARDFLGASGRSAWAPEIAEAIRQHHKVRTYRGAFALVEPFRRADWTDVTLGLRRFGLPRKLIRELYSLWPGAGFHRNLLRLEARHLRHHPLNPLPMFKL